jgi:hypothetical protein
MLFLWSCGHEKTVQQLFIQCPFAKIVWSIVHMALNITHLLNINNLFGTWLNGVPKTEKVQIRVGTCAILWAIWHCAMILSLTDHVFHHFCRLFL